MLKAKNGPSVAHKCLYNLSFRFFFPYFYLGINPSSHDIIVSIGNNMFHAVNCAFVRVLNIEFMNLSLLFYHSLVKSQN